MCDSEGMRAYSTDLRERLVRSVQAGRSQRETARVFGIGVSSVKRYLQQHRKLGTLAPKPIPGAERHIGPEHEEALRAQLTAHPDATLEQHCAWWEQAHGQQVSIATMSRALRRLRWTHKKSHWQPANETKPPVPPGARREATWMPGSSSLWMRQAPMWPSLRSTPGHPKASAPQARCMVLVVQHWAVSFTAYPLRTPDLPVLLPATSRSTGP